MIRAAPARSGPFGANARAKGAFAPQMRFAGMHKLSTLDFPGLVSAIVFVQGCNFHCPYCHNAHLIPERSGAQPLPEEEVLAFLRKRADVLDGLVISGGEPTLQAGLAGFCREVKALGYAVKLDSNGSRPEVLEALLEESLLDYVALDCKTGPGNYAPAFCSLDGIAPLLGRSAHLLRESGVAHEFRTTCVAPYVSPEHLEAMRGLAGDSPWFLQRARLDPAMRDKGLYPLSGEEMADLAGAAARWGRAPALR